MKAKTFLIALILFVMQVGQTFACSVCFGAQGSKVNDHMATAIWVMLAAIMSVLGGVGAFSFHLWRHSHMPLEPHQELAEEDFADYD